MTKIRGAQLPASAVCAAAGRGTPREIAPRFEYQPGPVKWSADGRTLYFNAGVRTTSQLFSVPAAGGEPRVEKRHVTGSPIPAKPSPLSTSGSMVT